MSLVFTVGKGGVVAMDNRWAVVQVEPMQVSAREWSLVLLKQGRPAERIALDGNKPLGIGRSPTNQLVIPDNAVSRKHAKLELSGNGPQITDLGSRHGLKVNGAPRQLCVLQDGDQIEIGSCTLRIVAERPFNLPAFDRAAWLKLLSGGGSETVASRVRLPEAPAERQLATLTHVCFWLAEGVAEDFFVQRCLALLLEGLQADEIQYYDVEGKLTCVQNSPDRKGKPAVKFAPYLARKMQLLTEVTRLPAKEVTKLQEHIGGYNYLVAPLRANAPEPGHAAPAPFLLVLKPVDWQDFTGKDAVLLQAVTALWIRATERARVVKGLHDENNRLKKRAAKEGGAVGVLVGEGPAMKRLREQARRLATTNAPILITGETGSGKEVAALFVHESSPRAEKAFVKLNCAAIPEGLIESELFGHVKGAFTDAKSDRDGKFQQANGGTLFLDEIGEMPLSVQAKVLRALESGEVEKVGGRGPKKVNVRVLAATHRDLPALVKAGRFREDLFFRLNVLSLRMPPLREHVEDLPVLAQGFLDRFAKENGLAVMTWSESALNVLADHAWPGNVRELRNIVQRCAALAVCAEISADETRAALIG